LLEERLLEDAEPSLDADELMGVLEGRGRLTVHEGPHELVSDIRRDDEPDFREEPAVSLDEEPPRTGSVVWDLDYKWGDQDWLAQRRAHNGLDAPMSVYEMHLGSWMRVPEEGGRSLSYRELAHALVEHVQRVGAHMQAGLRERFAGHPLVGEVRGVGLIGAIELVADKAERQNFDAHQKIGVRLAKLAEKHGVIARALADTLAFSPPLVITEAVPDPAALLVPPALVVEQRRVEIRRWLHRPGMQASDPLAGRPTGTAGLFGLQRPELLVGSRSQHRRRHVSTGRHAQEDFHCGRLLINLGKGIEGV